MLRFSKRDELLTGSDCAWSVGDSLDRVGQDARCSNGLVGDNWDSCAPLCESWISKWLGYLLVWNPWTCFKIYIELPFVPCSYASSFRISISSINSA